jgi:hypothetical protein
LTTTKLQSALDNTENCYQQINSNIQKFTDVRNVLDKQIDPATEVLSTPTKLLSSLERITMEPLPKRDFLETI